MNKLALLTGLFALSILTSAQEKGMEVAPSFQLGLTYSSFGYSDFSTILRPTGGTTYDGVSYKVVGLSYLYQIDESLNLETGIQWANHTLVRYPYVGPHDEPDSFFRDLDIITIPFVIRYVAGRYFFINSGMMLGFELKGDDHFDNQSGVGLIIGAGWKYEFKSKLEIFVNPEFRMHSIVPLFPESHNRRLIEIGMRVGILYRMKY